jgi:hypothetical protein
MTPRATLGLTLLLLAIVLTSGWWLWTRLASSVAPGKPAAQTAARAPSPAAPAIAPAGTPGPAGFRLAGVALGEPDSFAVVETPNGATALYRLHDQVAGLGELVRIDAERVLVRSAHGQFELWLSPAATATPTAVPMPTPHTPTARRQPRRPAARTTPAPAS